MEGFMLHTDMIVYQESMVLVKMIYNLCQEFPKSELLGLTMQMKRAVTSVPSNIAEGAGRKSTNELANFLNIALGSITELDTQLDIALMLEFVKNCQKFDMAKQQLVKVKKLLIGLKRSLQSSH